MDEVDGMSSGGFFYRKNFQKKLIFSIVIDRGGIAALIQMIKKSKIPIICICNDKHSTKVTKFKIFTFDSNFRFLRRLNL